ncbi:MAG: hypothetical protein JXA95_12485 [Spirochaetales bacterium]|nr:hypothetical protein [Spirochaetales bacterium]
MFDTDTFYNSNYEKTLAHLEQQKKTPSYSREDIEKELEALYIYEGQAWSGRGEIKDAEISSSIAAYQVFLSRN